MANCTYRSINLNEHSDYVRLLNIIHPKTRYIEYVVVDEEDTRLIEKFEEDIITEKLTNNWHGTKSSKRCRLLKIRATFELFVYLKQFATFCVLKTGNWGDYAEATDFGINDIAFFDEKDQPILFTTTHEGYIELRRDIEF
ncbi:MAG: hypothetical protein K2O08_00015 [Clostridia bacterium]|nr:hypothetical protein [Clostridia bacterium]